MVRRSRLSEPRSQYVTLGNDVEIWRTVSDSVIEPLEPRLGAGGYDLAAARAQIIGWKIGQLFPLSLILRHKYRTNEGGLRCSDMYVSSGVR